MPFEQFWEDTRNYEANNQNKLMAVKVRVDQNPNFNLAILKQNIDNIDNMTDVELRHFIERSFTSIMLNVFQGQDASNYVRKFQDARFLDAFIDVIQSMKYIDKADVIRCNTLCYHYLTLPDNQQDYRIKSRMLRLSSIINRNNLPRLLGLSLSENLASMLLIARYSDIDLNICVKRVDFIIMTQSKELMNERMIEEIFKILYNVFEDMERIFTSFMLDVPPEYDENNSWVTEDVEEISSTMNLAMLNIIENLPTQIIRRILMNYTEYTALVMKNRPVRFSLRSLSDDYYRINNMISMLQYNENIYVK